MKTRILYAKPSITDLEVEYATDAARNGWGDRCYEYITRFEELFKAHLGVKYAIATSGCTSTLYGPSALGRGPSDEVAMTDVNWIASDAPIAYVGAQPSVVDILPGNSYMGPEKAKG